MFFGVMKQLPSLNFYPTNKFLSNAYPMTNVCRSAYQLEKINFNLGTGHDNSQIFLFVQNVSLSEYV